MGGDVDVGRGSVAGEGGGDVAGAFSAVQGVEGAVTISGCLVEGGGDGGVGAGLGSVAGDGGGDLAGGFFDGEGVEGPDLLAGGDVVDGGGGAVGEQYRGAGQEAVGGAGDAVLVLLVLALVLLGAVLALPLGAGALGVGQEPGDLSSPQAGDVGDDVRGDLGGRAAVLALAPVLTGLVGNQDTARAERGAEEPVVH